MTFGSYQLLWCTMSYGTTQERAAEYQRVQAIQRQADEQHQQEEAQRLKLIEEQERAIRAGGRRSAQAGVRAKAPFHSLFYPVVNCVFPRCVL